MTGAKRGTASRRTVLKIAGTTGALAGLGTFAGSGRTQPADIALDARRSGWIGRSPDGIAGETNPTLAFETGRTYRVTWTNADGRPHNLVVTGADGNRLAGTEIVGEQGASRTVEFEATAAMAEYLCEVHPESMRGSVAVAEPGTTAGETTRGRTATAETTSEGPPPVIDEGTIVLGGQAAHWLGLAPSGVRGRPNPTLRLRAGREYELVWMNLDGVEHDFHLVDAGGDDVADTSSREDVGDTHETEFEATAGMAGYLCAFHPQSMRGGVEVV